MNVNLVSDVTLLLISLARDRAKNESKRHRFYGATGKDSAGGGGGLRPRGR
jgi:hypothetical protein